MQYKLLCILAALAITLNANAQKAPPDTAVLSGLVYSLEGIGHPLDYATASIRQNGFIKDMVIGNRVEYASSTDSLTFFVFQLGSDGNVNSIAAKAQATCLRAYLIVLFSDGFNEVPESKFSGYKEYQNANFTIFCKKEYEGDYMSVIIDANGP